MPRAELVGWESWVERQYYAGAVHYKFFVRCNYKVYNDHDTAIFLLTRMRGFGYDSGWRISYSIDAGAEFAGFHEGEFYLESGKASIVTVSIIYSFRGWSSERAIPLAEFVEYFIMPKMPEAPPPSPPTPPPAPPSVVAPPVILPTPPAPPEVVPAAEEYAKTEEIPTPAPTAPPAPTTAEEYAKEYAKTEGVPAPAPAPTPTLPTPLLLIGLGLLLLRKA
ncbi:MAG: hypothetical protein QXY75_03060 [Candidatus Bathyarchaeia archaeon]